MNRKHQEVTIDGTIFVVNELPAREMLPLVNEMSEGVTAEIQFQIMSKAVFVNGEPIDAGELGMSTYMQLMNVVMELNGLTPVEEGDEGNA